MKNIDRFNQYTARLFADLYASFPMPCDISYFEWLDQDALETDRDELAFCEVTIRWLEDAGYIHVGVRDVEGAYGIVLTAKGMEMMKVVPQSVKTKKSVGDALVGAVRDGMRVSAAQIVSRAFTEVFKLFS